MGGCVPRGCVIEEGEMRAGPGGHEARWNGPAGVYRCGYLSRAAREAKLSAKGYPWVHYR